MNASNGDGWHSSAGGSSSHQGMDQVNQQRDQRSLGQFGPPQNAHSGTPAQPGAPVLPPPSVPYHSANPQGGHTLPALVDLTPGPSSVASHQGPAYGQHPSGSSGHTLPGLGQAVQHQSPQSNLNRDRERESRDREMRERDIRDREILVERQRQQDEMAHREREREQLDRRHQELQHNPVQSHTGSIPIHQPVASKVPNVIHGPNGLLSGMAHGSGVNPPQPSGMFTGQGPPPEAGPRGFLQHPSQGQSSQQMMGFGSTASQMVGGVNSLAQGQQPILNDALSYLDQVKVRFVDHPDVYNKFLDIMKDFKSQAIDTPGVIKRVSTLFNGHPALIQGFNTFLPPGYRIECGTDTNPDIIRVTTPSGRSALANYSGSIEAQSSDVGPSISASGRSEFHDPGRPGWQSHSQQHAPHPRYSPNRVVGRNIFGQQIGQSSSQEQLEYQVQQEQAAANAALAHHQEQQSVAQLQSASAAAANGALGRPPMLQTVSGGTQSVVNGQANAPAGLGSGLLANGQGGDLNKRGPVEFNHAISYVNKIKNRFASQPEIYKQFLEILQTYQRESKPIQDVYAQVTHLFEDAQDLLEDFKQFLPESAAQAKAQAAARAAEENAILSNVRAEPNYNPAQLNQTARGDVKMPPLGQFNVKDSSKENKKRRAGGQPAVGTINQPSIAIIDNAAALNSRIGGIPVGNMNKRAKISHSTHKPTQAEMPVVSPTLIPQLPEPIPPTTTHYTSQEELTFFDRVKKFIGNKQSFNEFLKLCNLFTNDLIDKNTLIERASAFIGANPELMTWFKRFANGEPRDEAVEPKPKPDPGRVNLSHCRSLGGSYRLLPKREREKACSGRDEMCWEVLNDEWASHPTWASEDSGFVAHRKNQHEESLHRFEEERHDYDFNIETCLRTIQLIEPLVQQINVMSEEERATFTLPPGLGGHSEAIYQRVIKKFYDRAPGQRVIDEMFSRPCAVLPHLLTRLYQKCEEWKAGQREWEKVWREGMSKNFWKSLDHQGIHAKNSDRKQFLAKFIQNDVSTKHEEQRLQRLRNGSQTPDHQLAFHFKDFEVLMDATHLLLSFMDNNSATAESEKTMEFVKDFVSTFFDVDHDKLQEFTEDLDDVLSPNDEIDDETMAPEETASLRSRRAAEVNAKKAQNIRRVLEASRWEVDADEGYGTPDATQQPVNGEHSESPTPGLPIDVSTAKWLNHPSQGNFHAQSKPITLNERRPKKTTNLYCNLNLFCFFRTFEFLYSRLEAIKQHEAMVHEDVRRAHLTKPAHELNLVDKMPSDHFVDTTPEASYYNQIIHMCEEVVRGNLEMTHLEDTLRRFYIPCGWQLYNFDKLLGAITKFVSTFFTESRDRSVEVFHQFKKDRASETTTHDQELNYRKKVESLVKDSEIYRVDWDKTEKASTVKLMTRDESTFDTSEMAPEAIWSYYVSSYQLMDPTEGISQAMMRSPFLKKNVSTPEKGDPQDHFERYFATLSHQEGLVIRVATDNFRLLYETGSSEGFVRNNRRQYDPKRIEKWDTESQAIKDKRKEEFREKFLMNTPWMRDKSREDVDAINQHFQGWLAQGPPAHPQLPPTQTWGGDDEEMSGV